MSLRSILLKTCSAFAVALLMTVCLAAPITPSQDATPVGSGVRLLLVGLDGADWQIASPLIAAGRLPNLAMLKAGGAWGDLRSATPMLSPLL